MYKVQVLLSTYNGKQYLQELLKSVLSQKDVEVEILIRDDGSKDNTLQILEQYSDDHRIKMIAGKNLGFAQSFWQLVQHAGGAEYYAFCDQDDIWLEDKLISAVEMLEQEDKNSPLLYTSNVRAVDKELETLKEKAFPFQGVLSFADTLKRSVLPGCTFVFNDNLLKLAQMYNGYMIAHDWTIYMISSAFGKVVYDDTVHMLYRIHGNNEIGIDSKVDQLIKKIKRFIAPKTPNARSRVAKAFFDTYKEILPQDKYQLTRAFAEYRTDASCVFSLLKYVEYRDPVFILMLALRKV